MAKGKRWRLNWVTRHQLVCDTVSPLLRLPCCCWKMEQTPMLLTSWIPPPSTGHPLRATTASSSYSSNRAPQQTSRTRRAIQHCMCGEKPLLFHFPSVVSITHSFGIFPFSTTSVFKFLFTFNTVWWNFKIEVVVGGGHFRWISKQVSFQSSVLFFLQPSCVRRGASRSSQAAGRTRSQHLYREQRREDPSPDSQGWLRKPASSNCGGLML